MIIQRTELEVDVNAEFLPSVELQTPYRGSWRDEHHEIGNTLQLSKAIIPFEYT